MQPTDEPAPAASAVLASVRGQVDAALEAFLAAQRDEISSVASEAVALIDELARLVRAGGKRLRPVFCFWGHLAAGGEEGERIIRASAALELFHTFAIIHDDVMDASAQRRGVASTLARQGASVAILAGDLAAVLADRMLRDSGFPSELTAAAFRRYDLMRVEMAAGQFLDITGLGSLAGDSALGRPTSPGRVEALKTGSYTVEGPLLIGATLAGGSTEVLACLSRFGRPLGEAFQVRDDVLDEEPGADPTRVNELVDIARAALEPPLLRGGAAPALSELASALRLPT